MTAQAISLCFALIAVPATLIGWSIIVHNVRIGRVRKLAQSLPEGTRDRVLARINDAAGGSFFCTLLVPDHFPRVPSQGEANSKRDFTASRFGGPPYGESGDQWPVREDGSAEPADFLIQVRIDDTLPPPWPGRLIVMFLKFDQTQTSFVYTSPSSSKYVRRAGGPDSAPECSFKPLRIPRLTSNAIATTSDRPLASNGEIAESDAADNWQLPYDPTLLIESVDGLAEELRQFTARPVDLLTHLMLTERHGYDLDLSDIVQVGGRPQWVQSDPGPLVCSECGSAMRFLFQFGDLSGTNRLGDAGVCFVFGCDAHPEMVQSLVQSC